MTRTSLLLAIATGLSQLPSAALTQEDGAVLYEAHCSMCHGAEAEGDGPLSGALMLTPPDLTRLAERNGGDFPVVRVVQRIDGRDPLVSHGSPMPVYGMYFEETGRDVALATPSGQPILVSEEVAALAEYLRGLQR